MTATCTAEVWVGWFRPRADEWRPVTTGPSRAEVERLVAAHADRHGSFGRIAVVPQGGDPDMG